MIDFPSTFYDNYQAYLKDITYKTNGIRIAEEKLNIVVADTVSFELIGNSQLRIDVLRKVAFDPNVLYELDVSYGAILEIKEGVVGLDTVNWKKEFLENPICTSLLQGILARVSMLISQITSSSGQNPIITPPVLIEKN